MAYPAIRYRLSNSTASFLDDRSSRIFRFSNLDSLSIPNFAVKNRFPIISATPAVVSDRPVSNQIPYFNNADLVLDDRIVNDDREFYDRAIEIPSVSENLDDWIRGSVTEIVKNIRQAPLLLQINSNGEVHMEKAVKAKKWPNVITERSSSPDGIILVEELREDRDRESGNELKNEGGTKAFGVLIQGKVKGRDYCKSACYLLKTSSVNGGLGFVCTHYCLLKVKSFRESAFSQFNDCWLVK